MFNNGYNNNPANKAQSTNTRLSTWSCDYSCLQVRLWDDNLSLTFNVCTGKDANGKNTYDFQNKLSTAITPERAVGILNYLVEVSKQLEAYQDNGTFENSNIAFVVGAKRNRLCFEAAKDEQGIPSVYIRLYANVDINGASSDCVTYKMNHGEYYKNYDPQTGNGDRCFVEDELNLFVYYLSNLTRIADGKFDHHSQRYMKATDAAFASGFQNNGGNAGQFNNAPNNYQAPVSAMSSSDDYPF